MVTLALLLVVLALILAVAAGVGKVPLWIAVFLLAVVMLLRMVPLG